MNCPTCGAQPDRVAGIVLYENRDRAAYAHAFDVCWKDGIHRQRGQPTWVPLGQIATKTPHTLQWIEHSHYHFSMYLHGYQLHWWPTKRKVSWHGHVGKGYDQHKAMELARRIADDPKVRI